MEKTCKHCGERKSLELFYADSAARDGHRPECRACTAARRQRFFRQNREREIARVREWQQANSERHLESQRRRRQDPAVKRRQRAGYLRRKFGISVEQYDEMLAAQGGVCALCGRPPTEGISLHVDHEHETGAIRKLLCFRCNNALGDLGDDPDLLRAAARYLDDHDPKVSEMRRLAQERVGALRR